MIPLGSFPLAFVGQQYVATTPKQVVLLRGNLAEANPSLPLRHVAALVAAPPVSNAHVSFVEWLDSSSGDAPAAFEVQHVKFPVSDNNACGVTAMCAIPFGTNCSVSFVCSLSDRTVRVSARDADDDGSYAHRPYGSILRGVDSWSACCVVERRENGGVVVAATEQSSLHIVNVADHRLEAMGSATMSTGALSAFPITEMQVLATGGSGIDQEGAELLVMCHHTVCRVRLSRLAPGGGSHWGVHMIQAFTWSAHDPLVSITLRDQHLFAGSANGYVVVWRLGSNADDGSQQRPWKSFCAQDSTQNCPTTRAAVTGLVAHSSRLLFTGDSEGQVAGWRSSTGSSGDGASATCSPSDDRCISSGWAQTRLFPNPEALPSPSACLHGLPGIVAMASTNQFMLAVDASGILTVWKWLS